MIVFYDDELTQVTFVFMARSILLGLWMIWTDFVAEVKDKYSKVGEALCDYDVMAKCCVMSGRAGQSQSTSREL